MQQTNSMDYQDKIRFLFNKDDDKIKTFEDFKCAIIKSISIKLNLPANIINELRLGLDGFGYRELTKENGESISEEMTKLMIEIIKPYCTK